MTNTNSIIIFTGIESFPQTLNFYSLISNVVQPLLFKTLNSVRSNYLSLKYQRFTPSGWKGIAGYECLSLWKRLNFFYILADEREAG